MKKLRLSISNADFDKIDLVRDISRDIARLRAVKEAREHELNEKMQGGRHLKSNAQLLEEKLEASNKVRRMEHELHRFRQEYTAKGTPFKYYRAIILNRISIAKSEYKTFEEAVVDTYKCQDVGPDGDGGKRNVAYCQALKLWLPAELVRIARIVPSSMAPAASYIFDEVDGIGLLQSCRNGISLHYEIKAAMDQGRICLVPFNKHWVMSARDQSLLGSQHRFKGTNDLPWEEALQGLVDFSNSVGPDSRLVFHQFFMSFEISAFQNFQDWRANWAHWALWAEAIKSNAGSANVRWSFFEAIGREMCLERLPDFLKPLCRDETGPALPEEHLAQLARACLLGMVREWEAAENELESYRA